MSKPFGFTSTEFRPWQRLALQTAAAKNAVPLTLGPPAGQSWSGFGGCFNELGWHALAALAPAARKEIVALLFDPEAEGCRFTLGRLPIGASDYALEWYSHNEHLDDFAMAHFSIERDHKYLLPFIKAALKQQPGLDLFASPWSPPTWFKNPRAYNYGTMIWEKKYLAAYALYLAKFVEAYTEAGVSIQQVHVQNEPAADQKFPSCLWTGAQLREFIRDYLAPVFARRGLDVELWLGTLNTDDYNSFILPTLLDKKAAAVIAGVGLQWAGKGMVQRIHGAFPELPTMQTENECGNGQNTWAHAEYVFSLLQHYISNGVCGYVYWNMVLPTGGRSTWGWLQNAMISVDMEKRKVILNPEFWVMKHVARYVRNGARRLSLAGPLASNALGFENADGEQVVMVQNPLAEAIVVSIEGVGATLPARSICTVMLPT